MAKIYYDKDIQFDVIKDETIGIVGYGSQGCAHAQNLRDSGCQVIVASKPGGVGWKAAKQDGFDVMTVDKLAHKASIIVMLAPDTSQRQIYHESIQGEMLQGKTLMFAHGFNIHYSQIIPPQNVDVSMIAPKAPGHMVRQVFTEGSGVPSLVAVHQDSSGRAKDIALAYARGIGSGRAGVLETTFAEETETDLFGEQAVLCGGVSSLVKAGFETLVNAGYQPEIAYFECFHELKLIVDLMYKGGLSYMRYSISDTAEYGDYVRGPRVINSRVKEEMRQVLGEIQDGRFAKEWILEDQAGRPQFNALKQNEARHPIEIVGGKLRSMMSWLRE
ncbi:MAG: ketol-acid reductoisomerase [Dehalococcoidia bacterium]|nr:ketol-acid reductoisomerase [Dehalococcoidia bacterium]